MTSEIPEFPAARRSAGGRWKAWVVFGLGQVLAVLFVFRGALNGTSLLAPVDLAPALFPRWAHVGPTDTDPANHVIVDQLTYDLPLQWTIYRSVRAGEIPWWDPYMLAGRPLLADAHVNGTDPVRGLCYGTLPFELAYNWTIVLHFAIAGAGMFWLLMGLGTRTAIAAGFALAWEFSGGLVITVGHPWIMASFAWYPWLWGAARASLRSAGAGASAATALLSAAVFYSGNLQSHAYLPILAVGLVLGESARGRGFSTRGLMRFGVAIGCGVLLAGPVLVNQLEFYLLNVRASDIGVRTRPWLGALLTAAGMVHPWMLGTFRTLDLGKVAGMNQLGFCLYAGPVVLAAAMAGAGARGLAAWRCVEGRTSLFLVLAYLGVVGTPLHDVLYTRSAGLGLLGLVVLGSLGLERLCRGGEESVGWGRGAAWLALAILCVSGVEAYWVWPRIRGGVEAELRRRLENRESAIGEASRLRERQLRVFPTETGWRNPEVLLNATGWFCVSAMLLRGNWRRRGILQAALVGINVLPLVLFAGRFVPRSSIESWHKLRDGSAEHRRVADLLSVRGDRIWEVGPYVNHWFPNAMSHFFEVRAVAGYSALNPRTLHNLPGKSEEYQRSGDLRWEEDHWEEPRSWGRFRWVDGVVREAVFRQRGLLGFELRFSRPASGDLIWTDTRYPGWTVLGDGRRLALRDEGACFTRIPVAEPVSVLEFSYRPAWLSAGNGAAGAGLVTLALLVAGPWVRARKPDRNLRAV